ncbi:CopG family transcriptional regulator [Bdellovibrio sp. HCB290]|uniref:CopG family transcriptional regulator n=1 Tax=Bdellovibrio sp. HCB290 TaxID=3394356 RepID=UPI0039B3E18B
MKKEYDFSKAKRVQKSKEVKVIKTFRLDPEVLSWLEAEGEKQGMGYQTFLNWFLLKSMNSQESFEDRLAKLESAIFKKKA